MGRPAIALGTADSRAGVLDRSGTRAICREPRPTGDPARGTPGVGSVLSGDATGASQARTLENAASSQEVALHEIWSQLPLTERQHFGHRFSGMVLKALGLRPCPTQEAEV